MDKESNWLGQAVKSVGLADRITLLAMACKRKRRNFARTDKVSRLYLLNEGSLEVTRGYKKKAFSQEVRLLACS